MLKGSEQINRQVGSTGIKLNVQKVLTLIWRNWYLYLLTVILSGAGAYFFLQNRIPTYFIKTSILIGEGESRPGEEMLQGFTIRPGLQNLENQMLIISSFDIINKAVKELPFKIDVYKKGFRRQASYYPLTPFIITPGPDGFPINIEFIFEYLHDEKFQLTTSSRSIFSIDTIFEFGQMIITDQGSFTIYPQPEAQEIYTTGEKIYIWFYNTDALTGKYMYRLNVTKATQEGGIVNLSLEGTNWVKDIIFLNKLTEVFIEDNLDKKNLEAKRIIEFIDDQLGDYSDSLTLTENQLQEFRSSNRIMNVSAQAEQIVSQALDLENEKARLSLERNYYDYLEEYLSKEGNENAPIAPASMGITDPLLTNLLQELSGFQAEYVGSGVGERNPLQGQLEIRMRNTKKSIREALTGIMLANKMALDENEQQIENLNREAARLPVKERQLLGYERKFNLNNVMYTYLLQKRAEAQIQRASNTSDHVLVDQARSMGQVSPNMMTVFLFALFIAVALPTIIILLKDTIDNKITNEADLNSVTQMSVVAHLPHTRLSYNTVVLNEPSSRISEAFRSLRTRMEFYTKEVKCPLILVSSSMPGEGKTFAAINLASAYCINGKKTLLIGFDLRRPTLSKSFEVTHPYGMTDYLIGKKSLDEIIQPTSFDNLDIITSGTIPPNPGELTGSKKAIDLFSILKNQYEYIVVDSAPIGIVADIYSVAVVSDAVLLVVRHNLTRKNVLRATLLDLQDIDISNPVIILNDASSLGNSYRYSYKYKYDYKISPRVWKKKLRRA